MTQLALDMPPAEVEAFERWWQKYPRKTSKGLARRAWLGARKRASIAEIMAGLERYLFSPNPRLQPHPATWLNQERWADEQAGGLEDPWGLSAWYAAQADPGWTQDGYAELLEILNVPPRWTPDLDILGGWARDGYKHDSVAAALREMTKQSTLPRRYVDAFDRPIRVRCMRWNGLEYVREAWR
jgi:hypothetical protein